MAGEDVLESAVDTTVSFISVIAWAVKDAGPIVGGVAVIFEAIFGALYGSDAPSLLDEIKKIGDDTVRQLKEYMEDEKLKERMDVLSAFAIWTTNLALALKTSAPETYKFHLTKPGGALQQLNQQLAPGENTLFAVVNSLLADGDFSAGQAYDSPHHAMVAQRKLSLLFLAISQYITAMKLEIILVAKLYEFGYDEQGRALDLALPTVKNPDNTLPVLLAEAKRIGDALPGLIHNVSQRRADMVVLVLAECEVVGSLKQTAVADRAHWDNTLANNVHDALYLGRYHDQLVRAMDDHPDPRYFEHQMVGVQGHKSPYLTQMPWMRTEIRDPVVYDGEHPQNFVLSTSTSYTTGFQHNTERAEKLRLQYMEELNRKFQAAIKIPAMLTASVQTLADKWTPQIPERDDGGALIAEWGAEAGPAEPWSDKAVTVRYRYSLMSAALIESALSDKSGSTVWTEPNGKKHPCITGLPAGGDYLAYVAVVVVYRQFRREGADGSYSFTKERVVAKLRRPAGQAAFSGQHVDAHSTEYDEFTGS